MLAPLFWLVWGLVAWCHAGFLVFLRLLVWARPEVALVPATLGDDGYPRVTIIVPAFNEERQIVQKLQNLLALDYPSDRMTIIVASDGSTDGTNRLVKGFHSPRVRLIAFADRRGKACLTNDVVPLVSSEWLLFTDVGTTLAGDVLRRFAMHMAMPDVGAVDAEMLPSNAAASSIASDVGLFWRYESAVKTLETRLGILFTTFGGCTAVRRSAFRPLLPTEDIDFSTPLDAVQQGFRVVHEPAAKTLEETHSELRTQLRARARMVTKNLPGTLRKIDRSIVRRPLLLLAIVSHKLLRWLTPVLLFIGLLLNIALAGRRLFRLLLIFQAAFYALGGLGGLAWWRRKNVPIASSVFSFLVANTGFLLGVVNAVRGVQISHFNRYLPEERVGARSEQ